MNQNNKIKHNFKNPIVAILLDEDISVLAIVQHNEDSELISFEGVHIEKMRKKGSARQARRAYDLYRQYEKNGQIPKRDQDQYCMLHVGSAIFIVTPTCGKLIDKLNNLHLASIRPVSVKTTSAVSPKTLEVITSEAVN